MMLAELLILLPLLIYCILVLSWRRSWLRARSFAPQVGCVRRQFSLVITLHNEQENIEQLIVSLLRQTHRPSEIIFVCDHCTDSTEARLHRFVDDWKHAKVLVNRGKPGKKTAQRFGVATATHDIVAVADADCQFSPAWSSEVSAFFGTHAPDLLIAPVVMKGDGSFMQHLFELDFLSIQLCTAGAALGGRPFMCNGANLVFRKSLYEVHDGKERFVSGDDMFLLESIKRSHGRIEYIKNADTMTVTRVSRNFISFVRQHSRWLGKSRGYSDPELIIYAIVIFLANLVWPTFLLLAPGNTVASAAFVGSFVLKFIVDYSLLRSGRKFWPVDVDFGSSLVLALIYPFLMIIITITALIRGSRKW